MTQPLYLLADGRRLVLDPGQENVLGAARTGELTLDPARPSEPLATFRNLGHWMMRIDKSVRNAEVGGEQVKGRVVHFKGSDPVSVLLETQGFRAEFSLEPAEATAGPATPPPAPPANRPTWSAPPAQTSGPVVPSLGPPPPPPPNAGTIYDPYQYAPVPPAVPAPNIPPPRPPTQAAAAPATGPGWVRSTLKAAPVRPGEWSIGEKTVFGRGDEADIVVPDLDVALVHATLTRTNTGVYRLRDHGRGNGTFVGGTSVMGAQLSRGDAFTIGYSTFRLAGADLLREDRNQSAPALIVSGLSAVYTPRTRSWSSIWRSTRGKPEFGLRALSAVLHPQEVLAIVGPSGAGKSSFFRAMLGEMEVTEGSVRFRDLDLRTHAEQIRHQLGFVPQTEEFHDQLTVAQTLSYTAMLRLASDVTAQQRNDRVQEICSHLDLTGKLDSRAGTLSGGEGKRVSIALELLSGPAFLMLDEPTSSLDVGMAQDVMRQLASIASDPSNACAVAVVTHNTYQLEDVDRLLVLGTGGLPLYCGPPDEALTDLGSGNFAELMTTARYSPETAAARFASGPVPLDAQQQISTPSKGPAYVQPARAHHRVLWQTAVLLSREVALLRARGLGFLQHPTLALLGGGLAATAASASGLGGLPMGNPEIMRTITLMVTTCVFCGQALTSYNLVTEIGILRREHRTGMSPAAVIISKFLVFGSLAVLQTLLVLVVFRLVRPGPVEGLIGFADLDLAVCLISASLSSVALGMAISARGASLQRAIGWATATAICQVALNGTLLDLSKPSFLSVISMVLPARWATASVGALTNVHATAPNTPADPLWKHNVLRFCIDLSASALLTALFLLIAWTVLSKRLNGREH
jgi:ABC-type multidrug transport system ATPase subunit